MLKSLLIIGMFLAAMPAKAQSEGSNSAKYLTVVNLVARHKMKDKDVEKNLGKLREDTRFLAEMEKILSRLDNEKPNSPQNTRVKKILEDAGKKIYIELK